VAAKTGSTTVTVQVSEYGVLTTESFVITVAPVDHLVAQIASLPKYTLGVGAAPITVDLSSYLASADGRVTYAVTGNTDNSLLGVKIVGNILTISPNANLAGVAALTITATSIGAATGTKYQATGTINFNVVPTLSIDFAGFVRSGQETFAEFKVTMNAASNQNVAVNFATTNTTAIPGVDFTPLQGSVKIAAGTTSAMVGVAVPGTNAFPNLEFGLALSGASSARVTAASMTASAVLPMDRYVLIDQSTGNDFFEVDFTVNGGNAMAILQGGINEPLVQETVVRTVHLEGLTPVGFFTGSYPEGAGLLDLTSLTNASETGRPMLATATSIEILASLREIPSYLVSE
jgi:hypothetical protein